MEILMLVVIVLLNLVGISQQFVARTWCSFPSSLTLINKELQKSNIIVIKSTIEVLFLLNCKEFLQDMYVSLTFARQYKQ